MAGQGLALLFRNLAAREANHYLQAEGGCAEVCFGIGAHKGRTSVLDFYDVKGTPLTF